MFNVFAQILVFNIVFVFVHRPYARVNQHMPAIRVYLDVENDMRPDFRLSREAFHGILSILSQRRDHGWGPTFEVLLFVYWLAHAVSYRVAARAFDMPNSTVCRILQRVAFDIRRCKAKVISVPTANMLGDIGRGFGQLAQRDAFNNAVGAIGGCHIRNKKNQAQSV